MGVGIATGIICALAQIPRPAGRGALAATLNFIPIMGPIATFVVLTVVGIVALPSLALLAFCGLPFSKAISSRRPLSAGGLS